MGKCVHVWGPRVTWHAVLRKASSKKNPVVSYVMYNTSRPNSRVPTISTKVWAMRASSSLRLCVPCNTASCGITIRHLLISGQIPPRSILMTFSLSGPFLFGFCEVNFYKISCCTVNWARGGFLICLLLSREATCIHRVVPLTCAGY